MNEIRLENIRYQYPDGDLVLDGVSINIHSGENIAIIGENGAGKSTTAKLMNGLLKPDSGAVFIDDKNTKDHTTAQISRIVGYVFQNPDDQIFHATVKEEVSYGPKSKKLSKDEVERRVKEALQLTGMEEYQNENPMNLPLSLRRFVTIASVIAMDTEVLIFDEPTAGQDLRGNERLKYILKTLHEKGKTLITISHDMDFVANTIDRIIVMANKKVVTTGTPKEVFWNLEALEVAHLSQPYVSRVCKALGVKGNVVTISEAIDKLLK